MLSEDLELASASEVVEEAPEKVTLSDGSEIESDKHPMFYIKMK